MNLSTFWKSKWVKVRIILKSGKEINFECENMTWKTDERVNIISYEIKTFKSNVLSYVHPSEIAAIMTIE